MASSLFSQIPQAQRPAANNPFQMVQQFQKFRQEMAGKDPAQVLDGLVKSGQMSEQQKNALFQQAQSLMGMFRR